MTFSATLIESESSRSGDELHHLQFLLRGGKSKVRAGDVLLLPGGGRCATVPETNPPGFHAYVPKAEYEAGSLLLQVDSKIGGLQLEESEFAKHRLYDRMLLVAEGMQGTKSMVSLLKTIQEKRQRGCRLCCFAVKPKLKRLHMVWLVRAASNDQQELEHLLRHELDQAKLLAAGVSVELSVYVVGEQEDPHDDDSDKRVAAQIKESAQSLKGINWPMQVHCGTPDFVSLLRGEMEDDDGDDGYPTLRRALLPTARRPIGVFTCTSPALLKHIQLTTSGASAALHAGHFFQA